MTYACACCGYLTLDEPTGGTFDICEVCGWEDDDVQLWDWSVAGGANRLSLVEAQRAFSATGRDVRDRVRDPRWRPVDPARDGKRGRAPYWLS